MSEKMHGSDVEQKVKAVIAKNLEVPVGKILPESTFIQDLGADSLAIVEMVLALEEEFDLDIPDDETAKIRTVQDAVNYIVAHAKS